MKSGSRSIALRYNDTLPAPFVIAKGKGELAVKLLALAKEHDIAIVRQDDLAESLFCVDVGEFIPERFYLAVAQVLAHIVRLSVAEERRKGADEEDQGQ